jgi:LPXTG-site transpeptidase (sortase) family protein
MNTKRYKKYDLHIEPRSKRRLISDITPVVGLSPAQNQKTRVSAKLISDISHKKRRPSKPRTINTKMIMIQLVQAHTINEESTQSLTLKKSYRPKNLGKRLYFAFGSVVFILSAGMNIYSLSLNKQVKDQASKVAGTFVEADEQGVAQGTGSEPESEKPSDNAIFDYIVSPDKPRYLRIPSQSVTARVKELGIASDGSVDAPWNVHDVGWYSGSITPGSKNGVSLLLGHVSGKIMPGVFKNIAQLPNGALVEVEKGNGQIHTYEVEKIEEYETKNIDMAKILYEVEQGKQSLRLITCAGAYDSDTGEYKSRTVVYLSPTK